jgi:hypothetical protein
MAPAQTTQISAHISETTSSELERYVDARGLKKGYVIEQALRHYLRALHELPADAIVPPQLLVSTETAEHLADRMEKPRKPTAAMRSLFSKK